jgi:hypothetical protein
MLGYLVKLLYLELYVHYLNRWISKLYLDYLISKLLYLGYFHYLPSGRHRLQLNSGRHRVQASGTRRIKVSLPALLPPAGSGLLATVDAMGSSTWRAGAAAFWNASVDDTTSNYLLATHGKTSFMQIWSNCSWHVNFYENLGFVSILE